MDYSREWCKNAAQSKPPMKSVKRLKKDDTAETKPTRTLLVSKIKNEEENTQIRESVAKAGSVREIYTIRDSVSILFVIMHDTRECEKAFGMLKSQGKCVTYTVSKYEIPREIDRCDESKNQGTLLLVSRDLEAPFTDDEVYKLFEEFGDVKCVREYKTFQRFIEFYDSRCAVAAYKKLHEKPYGKGTTIIRFVWDMTSKQRWAMIANTDAILKSAEIEDKDIPGRASDKNIYDKNFFLKALDDFIVENLDKLEKLV